MSITSGSIISSLSVRFFYGLHTTGLNIFHPLNVFDKIFSSELEIANKKNSEVLATARSNARQYQTLDNQKEELLKRWTREGQDLNGKSLDR